MRAGLRIVLTCTAAAIVYGILHDLVTVHISLEYFTIGHPDVGTQERIPLALIWGVLATWWAGAVIGLLWWWGARGGSGPKLPPSHLHPYIRGLFCFMAGGAAIGAGLGHWLAGKGWIVLMGPIAKLVPMDAQRAFLTAGGAHTASYLIGFVGGVVVTWRLRHGRRVPGPRARSDG